MVAIKKILAREILDSRGNPTIEVQLETRYGTFTAGVPSGASTGSHEALELRDGGKRYQGKGVLKAVRNAGLLARKLKGIDVRDQKAIDNALLKADSTPNKSRYGANAILGLSLACCKAGAASNNLPLYQHIAKLFGNKKPLLPVPAFNIINGGKHAGNKLDFQEYMLLPKAKSFREAVQTGAETYHELKELLKKRFGPSATNVGDEGGFAPPITCIEEPFDFILDAAANRGFGSKARVGIDAAATSFFVHGKYSVEGKLLTAEQLSGKYQYLQKNYPLVSLEDPFYEEGWDDFSRLTAKSKAQIVGDDLLVTNVERIKMAIKRKACSALLLKVNQIGTITEALQAARLAIDNEWKVMVSHRSGETGDDFIADLAVGLGCGQIKAGAPCRGERVAKYNRLAKIELEGLKYASW